MGMPIDAFPTKHTRLAKLLPKANAPNTTEKAAASNQTGPWSGFHMNQTVMYMAVSTRVRM